MHEIIYFVDAIEASNGVLVVPSRYLSVFSCCTVLGKHVFPIHPRLETLFHHSFSSSPLHILQHPAESTDLPSWLTVSELHHSLGKLPALGLALDRVLHGGRNACSEIQPPESVFADCLDVAEAAETFFTGEAAIARAAGAAKGELHGVVGGEVVDGDHAGADPPDDGLEVGVALGAVDRGAEAEVGGVGDGEDVGGRGGLGAEDGEDGGEALVLGDAHVGRDVGEQRGLEVVALGELGV